MRADRLISLVILLQTHSGMTARQLADELEVSERTIYRDLTALNTAGIPVYTRSGPGGGCYLVEEYRTDLTGMTTDQVRALSTLGIPAPLDQLGFSQHLKGALLKLAAAMPSSQRDESGQTRQRLYLDWGFDAAPEAGTGQLKTIQHAVWEDRLLRLRYRSLYSWWIDPREQVAAPYSLVAWAGEWYLVCFWDEHGHVLPLRLIEASEVLPIKFSRPSDFDLSKFWLVWRRRFESDRPSYPVRVRVSPPMVPFLRNLQGGIADDQGWVTGTLTFETFEIAHARILSYGGAVEVLEPEALRCSIMDYAGQIIQLYREEEP
jgi:predicted DNA-binding transcriptional regulator YafY